MRDAMPKGTHSHKWDTNPERTRRTCATCGAVSVKHKGKWKRETVKSGQLPDGTAVNVRYIGER